MQWNIKYILDAEYKKKIEKNEVWELERLIPLHDFRPDLYDKASCMSYAKSNFMSMKDVYENVACDEVIEFIYLENAVGYTPPSKED